VGGARNKNPRLISCKGGLTAVQVLVHITFLIVVAFKVARELQQLPHHEQKVMMSRLLASRSISTRKVMACLCPNPRPSTDKAVNTLALPTIHTYPNGMSVPSPSAVDFTWGLTAVQVLVHILVRYDKY
jgi:hypothetical protein